MEVKYSSGPPVFVRQFFLVFRRFPMGSPPPGFPWFSEILRFPLFFFGFRGQVEILSFLKNHGKGWLSGCAKIFPGEKLIKSKRKFRTGKKGKFYKKKTVYRTLGMDP